MQVLSRWRVRYTKVVQVKTKQESGKIAESGQWPGNEELWYRRGERDQSDPFFLSTFPCLLLSRKANTRKENYQAGGLRNRSWKAVQWREARRGLWVSTSLKWAETGVEYVIAEGEDLVRWRVEHGVKIYQLLLLRAWPAQNRSLEQLQNLSTSEILSPAIWIKWYTSKWEPLIT